MTRVSVGQRLPLGLATLALVVAASGTAIATNGRPGVLGEKNHATSTTTLKDAEGTPLTLAGGRNKPPLTVGHDTTAVPSLNASLLGSIPASSFGNRETVLAKPGTFTVKVPKGFGYALVTATSGGGGGGVTGTGITRSQGSAGGGAGGTGVVLLRVTAGERLTAVVGSGGAVGADGTFSSLRPATTGASDWAVKVLPGTAGQAMATCPAVAQRGSGGAVLGPTAAVRGVSGVTAIGVKATPGHSGQASGCSGSNIGSRGARGGLAGVAGSGGNGGDGIVPKADAAAPGLAGIITIEFLG